MSAFVGTCCLARLEATRWRPPGRCSCSGLFAAPAALLTGSASRRRLCPSCLLGRMELAYFVLALAYRDGELGSSPCGPRMAPVVVLALGLVGLGGGGWLAAWGSASLLPGFFSGFHGRAGQRDVVFGWPRPRDPPANLVDSEVLDQATRSPTGAWWPPSALSLTAVASSHRPGRPLSGTQRRTPPPPPRCSSRTPLSRRLGWLRSVGGQSGVERGHFALFAWLFWASRAAGPAALVRRCGRDRFAKLAARMLSLLHRGG